jgi:hypothetical protein
MSAELLAEANVLQGRSIALLQDYKKLHEKIVAAKNAALNARAERGLLQIAADGYLEAEETAAEQIQVLEDSVEFGKDLLRELGEV